MLDLANEGWRALTELLAPHGPVVHGVKSYGPGDFSVHFFLQLAVIILACRVVGWLGQKLLRQPQVVGEMIAGAVLGPSPLGLAFPGVQNAIFPPETRNVLYVGAQLGVGLYMFMVGLKLRLDHFKSQYRASERHYRPDPLLDVGADGDRHDDDGEPRLRVGLWPPGARDGRARRARSRAGDGVIRSRLLSRHPSESWDPRERRAPVPITPWGPSFRWGDGEGTGPG